MLFFLLARAGVLSWIETSFLALHRFQMRVFMGLPALVDPMPDAFIEHAGAFFCIIADDAADGPLSPSIAQAEAQ